MIHRDVVSGAGVEDAVSQVAPGDVARVDQLLVGPYHAVLQAELGQTDLSWDYLLLIWVKLINVKQLMRYVYDL